MTEEKKTRETVEDSSTYLTEPYITEDGIEVPPPTRPMGPRRLARYREDAAAYLRALRDGSELPDEPVAYLPDLNDGGQVESPENLSFQQRFHALANQGGIDTSTDDSDLFAQGGKDTRDVLAATLAAEEPASAAEFDFAETYDDSEVMVEEEAVDSSERVEDTDALPAPVSALNAQGLDLSEIRATEQTSEPGEENKPETHPAEVLPHDHSEDEQESEKKSGTGLWILLSSLLIVAVLVAVWFIFFQ